MRGHVRKRGKTWQAIVHLTDPVTGEKRHLSGTRATKGEADSLMVKLLAQAGRANTAGSKATVTELLDAWQTINESAWSPATIRQQRSVIARYLKPRLGNVLVRKVRTADLDKMYAELRRSGGVGGKELSAATVRRVHTVLRSALTQAVRWEWIADNPAARATIPRGPRKEILAPKPSEIVAIVEAAVAADPDFGAWLHLAAATGARRGEICALRWRDVDLDHATVTIARSISLGETIVEKDTKTGNRRKISLDADTIAMLRAHRRRAAANTLAAGGSLDPAAYLFSLEVGGATPWRPDLATHRFVRLRRQLGLEHVRLHDLRHFQATTLLGAGIDLATVAGRLGHAGGGRTTLAVYAHAAESADATAADLIGGVLRGGRKAE